MNSVENISSSSSLDNILLPPENREKDLTISPLMPISENDIKEITAHKIFKIEKIRRIYDPYAELSELKISTK